MELDEFERGYPRLTLSLLMDVVGACLAAAVEKEDADAAQLAPRCRREAGEATSLMQARCARRTSPGIPSPGARCWAGSAA